MRNAHATGAETMTALKQDPIARAHGRVLYHVYLGGKHIGTVGRWMDEKRWTVAAQCILRPGRDDPRETYTTRRAALADLLEAHRESQRCPRCETAVSQCWYCGKATQERA